MFTQSGGRAAAAWNHPQAECRSRWGRRSLIYSDVFSCVVGLVFLDCSSFSPVLPTTNRPVVEWRGCVLIVALYLWTKSNFD